MSSHLLLSGKIAQPDMVLGKGITRARLEASKWKKQNQRQQNRMKLYCEQT
jgi:hypothetical protein